MDDGCVHHNTNQSNRRPSFPQSNLNWRTRHKQSEEKWRRSRKSLGAHEENYDGEKDEDGGGANLFPESMPCYECTCPMTHFHREEETKNTNGTPTTHTPNATTNPNDTTATTAATNEDPNQHGQHHQNVRRNDSIGNNNTTSSPSSTAFPSSPFDFEKKYHASCSCSDLAAHHYSSPSNYKSKKCHGNSFNRCNSNTGVGGGGGGGGGGCGGGSGRGCSGEFSRNQRRSTKETVVINVGGQIFETYRSTLRRLKTPVFNSEKMFRSYYRKNHGDYFFDRDPMAFGSVLNFLRTGELHIPTNMCGPALQNELEFWGMEELDIARCCWTQYNTWKTQCRSLEKLEYDRKFSTTQQYSEITPQSTCMYKFKSRVWTLLQDPASSIKAKIYAWISIIFVFISIFSFCAETHPLFKVKARDMTQFAAFYEFFNLQSIQWDVLINQTNSQSNAWNATADLSDDFDKHSGDIMNHHHGFHYPSDNNDDYDNNNNEEDMGDKDLPHPVLLMMDVACLMFFTLEYFTRFLCSPSKLDFVRALQNVVDILAFAPDYVELLFLAIDPSRHEGMDIMEMLFILRILRLFRIFRLIRHVPGLWILLYTLKASFNELMLMFVFLIIGMVVFATLIHFVEPDGWFSNIPVGFWWSVVTMTTVGYGDMYPQTGAGYAIGSCCAVAGLLMIAFTVPIIVSNFVLYYTHVQYGLARKDREAEKQREEAEEEELRVRIENKINDPEIGNCTTVVSDSKRGGKGTTTSGFDSTAGCEGRRRMVGEVEGCSSSDFLMQSEPASDVTTPTTPSTITDNTTATTTTTTSGTTTATITRNGVYYTGLINNSDEENIEMNERSPMA